MAIPSTCLQTLFTAKLICARRGIRQVNDVNASWPEKCAFAIASNLAGAIFLAILFCALRLIGFPGVRSRRLAAGGSRIMLPA
jgi:hypothetical protein